MKKVILSATLVWFASQAIAQSTTPPPPPAPPVQQHVNTQPDKAPTPAAAPADDKNAPDIVFDSEVIDYGTIDHFADGKREFHFKNKGKSPLVITNCVGSCGCTVPTWPKDPIKPGKTATILVTYATDRVGTFEKTVTVTSNAKTPTKVIKIKGTVKPEPATKPGDATTPVPAQPPVNDHH